MLDLFFMELMDEEYKGKFFPFFLHNNKEYAVPNNYNIETININPIPREMKTVFLDPNRQEKYEYENALNYIQNITNKNDNSFKTVSLPAYSKDEPMIYNMGLYQRNQSFLSISDIIHDDDSEYVYFILEADQKDGIYSSVDNEPDLDIYFSIEQNFVTIVNDLKFYLIPDYPNLFYIEGLKLVIDNLGVVVGSGDIIFNETNYSIINLKNKIHARYVRNIERIGFYISQNTIIDVNEKEVLYSEYKLNTNRIILLFQWKELEDKDEMILLSQIPDLSRNYKIIDAHWLTLGEATYHQINRYGRIFDSLLKEYGMKRNYTTNQFVIEQIVDGFPLQLNFDGSVNWRNFEIFFKENPKSIDEHFINKMTTREGTYPLTMSNNANIEILTRLSIDDLIYAKDFHRNLLTVIDKQNFVISYLRSRGYPETLIRDKPDNMSYFEFLVQLMKYFERAKSQPNKVLIPNSYQFKEARKYFIMKSGLFTGRFNMHNIQIYDTELLEYIFENELYDFSLLPNVNPEINEERKTNEILDILDDLVKYGNIQSVDYLVQKFHVQPTDTHFKHATKRDMIRHLVIVYDLPTTDLKD